MRGAVAGPRRIELQRFVTALRVVEDSIVAAWRALLLEYGTQPDTPDEHALAEAVVEHPNRFDWRVVDGALAQLRCPACAQSLGSGPADCVRCEVANGLRFAAMEVDRPGMPPGNEHALRVASAVARTRERYSARARCGYEVALPDLLDGKLPTTAEAQAAKAMINVLSDEELERWLRSTRSSSSRSHGAAETDDGRPA